MRSSRVDEGAFGVECGGDGGKRRRVGFWRLTADGVIGTSICETVTRMRLQARYLEVLVVGTLAGSQSTTGSHWRKSQKAACDRGKLHDGG